MLWGNQALWVTAFSTAILFSAGFWTAIRSNTTGSKPGRVAIKTAFLATWPSAAMPLLMLVHSVPVIGVGPNGTGHPFAFVYRDSAPPSHLSPWFFAWVYLCSFFLNLPVAGLIGLMGGMAGRFTWWAARHGRARAN